MTPFQWILLYLSLSSDDKFGYSNWHTLPTNQLIPPASITDTTAFWRHINLSSQDGIFMLREWSSAHRSESISIKECTIDTTFINTCCRSLVFSTTILDRPSSPETSPAIVLSWITAPEIEEIRLQAKSRENIGSDSYTRKQWDHLSSMLWASESHYGTQKFYSCASNA